MRKVTAGNTIFGDGKPKICIPITARSMAELEEQIERAAQAPCDMIEWRADYFTEEQSEETGQISEAEGKEGADGKDGCEWILPALRLLKERIADKPLLFTFRTKEEGGERRIAPEEYERLNQRAAAAGLADFVDIEINRGEDLFCRLCGAAHDLGVSVIGSFHDFEATPSKEKLEELLCRMQTLGADITKAAVMPRDERDVLTLLEASVEMKLLYADRPFITMAMGPLGAVSRLCGALTGSSVTFASAGKASAPGQLDAGTVADVLNSIAI